MEEIHTNTIQSNFLELVNNCNATLLLECLERTCVFQNAQIQDIKNCKTETEKSRKIFLDIQTRGPKAFEYLIRSLVRSNQSHLAHLLDPQNVLKENTISRGAVPFRAPINALNACTIQEEIKVIKAKDFMYEKRLSADNVAYYNTTSESRGVVAIFNFFKVHGHKDRVGSLKDVENLHSLFSQIGFKILEFNDRSFAQFEQDLISFSENPLLQFADIAMVFIMSHGMRHGSDDYVCCADGALMTTQSIENHFSNHNCKFMHNKPKIIVYEICRGSFPDTGINLLPNIETDGEIVYRNNTIHSSTDLLILHATIPDHAAHRDTDFGTWYIYWICMIFMKEAHNKDVATMIEMVQEKLKHERSLDLTMQSGEFINRSFKKCFLNPGIYRKNGVIHKFKEQ